MNGRTVDFSEKTPVHLNWNMDYQNRFDPQEPNPHFPDGRSMRPMVKGTVAQGFLKEDDHLYRGKVGGDFAKTVPAKDADGRDMTLDRPFLERGQQRYHIFCSPCHDSAGTGNGIVVERGMMKPPSLHEERLRALPVGYFYDVITHGVRNMSPYAAQIALRDRWAVAAYVRTLQLSRNATINDIPVEKIASERWEVR
jgi:mono/diheme cytochrome c family protein